MTRQPNEKTQPKSASSAKTLPVLSDRALARIQGGVGFLQQSAAHGDEASSPSGTSI